MISTGFKKTVIRTMERSKIVIKKNLFRFLLIPFNLLILLNVASMYHIMRIHSKIPLYNVLNNF